MTDKVEVVKILDESCPQAVTINPDGRTFTIPVPDQGPILLSVFEELENQRRAIIQTLGLPPNLVKVYG